MINNWIYCHIPGAKEPGRQASWTTGPVSAHARTLVLASKHNMYVLTVMGGDVLKFPVEVWQRHGKCSRCELGRFV